MNRHARPRWRRSLAQKLGITTSPSSALQWRALIPPVTVKFHPQMGVGTERRLATCGVAMRNFAIKIDLVAMVRVRASDEKAARKIVPTSP
jgi:hypothetical protein